MIIHDTVINVSVEEIIKELKSQLSANGIELFGNIKNTENDLMVSCPYHKNGKERRPSAGIRKLDGQFHCFSCGETHSIQEVISYCFGWNDVGGVKGLSWILKNFAVTHVEIRKPINLDFERKKEKNEEKQRITEIELDKYRYLHIYMYKRKLTDEIIDIFDIGYDKDTDCITFPQRDINGDCLFIARRSVKGKYFNYPKEVDKIVYGLYEIYKECKNNFPKEIVICESMIDSLTCWVYGKYAVALNGLGTKCQIDTLNKLRCRKFILATDNDTAGKRAREKLKKQLKNHVVTEYIFPDGKKDINELTKEEFDNLKEVF